MPITEKELSWIEDQLTLEQLLIAKYRNAANNVNDSNLQSKLNEIASKHESHYNTVLSHLN